MVSKLVAFSQGKMLAAEYAACFQEVASHANFSDDDLKTCFRMGLN